MKSERPENDDGAAEGTTGEPPEAEEATESPEAAANGTGATAESTGTTAVQEPEQAAEPEEDPEPEETPEPDLHKAPGPPGTPEPEPERTPEPRKTPQPEPERTPEPEEAIAAESALPEPSGALRSAEPEAAARSDTPDAPEAQGTDQAGHPTRRRSPAAVIVSVAAAVLLIGGGGAYLAASTASGDGGGGGGSADAGASGGSTPPPLALDGYSAGGNGTAPGEPNPYGVTYKASGTLPGAPGPAAVYQPSGEVSEDRVAALAKALGIEGAPVAEGQVWKVGTDSHGSRGSLQVNRAAPGIWTYSRYAPGTGDCKSTLVCTQDPAAPAGDAVSVAVAEKAAAPVLKAVGQDDAKLDASQVMGVRRVVNADPVVGGLPTYGWTTGLTVSKQGVVVGGNGMLATPEKGDPYPVLSAAKTLALMNAAPRSDHRMGIGGCASSVPLKDRFEQPCAASTPSPSSAVIEQAVFGLAARSVSGRQALVPSWLFQVRGAADSYTVTYPAVDPKYLASSSTPSPSASGSASASAAPKDVKVDGYTADGRELSVAFTGGVCADYRATADEGTEQVVVKVTATPWPDKVCIMIAKQYHQTVRLDAPLDGRKVVGTDGGAVPKEHATTLHPRTG